MLAVTAWACWALEHVHDGATLGPLQRYQDRLLSLAAAGRIPEQVGPVDRLVMQVARTRLELGDSTARRDLVPLLLSDDEYTRQQAIDALASKYGGSRGYDPDGPEAERRSAAAAWNQ